jgi:phosphoribosylformylglycinamidine cyclo-ligase
MAHVTGGGLPGNLPRALGADLSVLVRPSEWPESPLFSAIARAAHMDGAEMRATFNGGIGFALIVEPAAAQPALDGLAKLGHQAWAIGEVLPTAQLDGSRYVEAA